MSALARDECTHNTYVEIYIISCSASLHTFSMQSQQVVQRERERESEGERERRERGREREEREREREESERLFLAAPVSTHSACSHNKVVQC